MSRPGRESGEARQVYKYDVSYNVGMKESGGGVLSVRGVDAAVWRSALVYGVEHGLPMGQLVTDALVRYVGGGAVTTVTEGKKQGSPGPPVKRSSPISPPTKGKRAVKRADVPVVEACALGGETRAEREERRQDRLTDFADIPDKPGKRTSRPPAEIKPCSHGLLFHPRCTDAG